MFFLFPILYVLFKHCYYGVYSYVKGFALVHSTMEGGRTYKSWNLMESVLIRDKPQRWASWDLFLFLCFLAAMR